MGPVRLILSWIDWLVKQYGRVLAVLALLALIGVVGQQVLRALGIEIDPEGDSAWQLYHADLCLPGDLQAQFDGGFLRDAAGLANDGATDLRICDRTTIRATLSEMPGEIVKRYPGCLKLRQPERVLSLSPNPAAVCRHEGRIFCDGERAAAQKPALAASLVERGDLPDCASLGGVFTRG